MQSMYLPRTIDRVLLEWSRSAPRKPLILRGARQTGKTEAVRRLGAQFELFVELNLERFEDLALVRASSSADDLLTARECACRLRVHASTIHRWIRSGDIPAWRIRGTVRVRWADVQRVLERRGEQP